MQFTRNTRRERSDRPARTASTRWYDSPWQIVGRAVGTALAIAVLGALLALVVVPRLLSGDSLTVLSGSMEPTFSPGDVVVVKGVSENSVCADVSVGSIVTFFPEPNDPTLITHRVVGKTIGTFEDGSSCRLITQGDANSAVDAPVSPAQVRGLFMYGVPGLGWIRQWAGQNPALLGGIGAAVVVGWILWGALRKPRTTVVAAPPSSAAGGAAGAGTPDGAGVPVEPSRERELRERDFQLRERELELRERELAFAMGDHASADPAPPEDPTRDDLLPVDPPPVDPPPDGPPPDDPEPVRRGALHGTPAPSLISLRETRHDRANHD